MEDNVKKVQKVRKILCFCFSMGFLSLVAATFVNCTDTQLFKSAFGGAYSSTFGGITNVAVASRQPACLACHANIHGDWVIDFSYGTQNWFGLDPASEHPGVTSPAYSPYNSRHVYRKADEALGMSANDGTGIKIAFNSNVYGNLYVPSANLTVPEVLNNVNKANPLTPYSTISLATLMTTPFIDPNTGVKLQYFNLTPASMASNVNVYGVRGKIIPKQTVRIDYPDPATIEALASGPDMIQIQAAPQVAIYKTSNANLSGMSLWQSSATGQWYTTNPSPSMACAGDVVIRGSLFLNNLNLTTDARGCRLYVDGTVFIQGPVTYVGGGGGDETLQITSSRAIIMGMRNLSNRLTTKVGALALSGIRSAPTEFEEATFNNQIMEDAAMIDGLTNDAGPIEVMYNSSRQVIAVMDNYDTQEFVALPPFTSFPPVGQCAWNNSGTPCGIAWEGEGPNPKALRKSYDFKHMFLNAPKIYSRYFGSFTGFIVGDDVMFALGNFDFYGDPVFNSVPVLPLLNDSIFYLSSN